MSAESDIGGSGSNESVARIHNSLSDLVMLQTSFVKISVPLTGTTVPDSAMLNGAAVGEFVGPTG